jgi:hypothetical protein
MLCKPVKLGGMSCIDIDTFITSLQCSWIKRAHNSNIDIWRRTLNNITGDDVGILSPDMFDRVVCPLLHGFVESFCKFKSEYLLRNDNFLNSSIIGNPLLIDSNKLPVFNSLWTDENDLLNVSEWKNLKILDILTDRGTAKSKEDLSVIFNRLLTDEKFANINRSLTATLKQIKKNKVIVETPDPVNINSFLQRFKKGSKPFRKILTFRGAFKFDVSKSNKVKTFF